MHYIAQPAAARSIFAIMQSKNMYLQTNFFGFFSSVTCKQADCSTVLRLKEPKFLQIYALDG